MNDNEYLDSLITPLLAVTLGCISAFISWQLALGILGGVVFGYIWGKARANRAK